MEEHLNDKNRLGKEWKELENYEPDRNSTYVGSLPAYMARNRYSNIIPCNFDFKCCFFFLNLSYKLRNKFEFKKR